MKRKMKGKIGKVIKELCVFGVVIAIGTNIVGCGDDTKKESKKTTKTNMVTTSDSSEETTVNNENETITEEQEIDVSTDTATKESDSDTVAQQVATTKPVETTKPEYTVTKLDKTMYAKSTVNVRKGPSTDFEKVGSLSAGKQVKVVGQSDQTGWYLIQFDGKEGYVSNSYLQDKPVETTTPKPTTTKAPSTSNGKTETTTKNPSSDDNLSPEELAAKYNPNWWKHDKYVIAKNPDGSYDVKNCILGTYAGVPREQIEMDVYYIFIEKLGDKLVVPEGWEVLIGNQRRYNEVRVGHFDVRDWELIVMEKTNSGFCWIFDENFELKKVSFSETN